jgi:hypothetical protein
MSDNKQDRGSPDNKRIDVNDPNELRHWSSSLGVTQDELRSDERRSMHEQKISFGVERRRGGVLVKYLYFTLLDLHRVR